ncbi:hypothetical protein ACIBKX_11355 [Streptomyces sp. NPDC050658]|uniref:hypothetical protein n=1 Tax=unclassified Streptomyces TaxID=2593676 RepID=UPI00342E1043
MGDFERKFGSRAEASRNWGYLLLFGAVMIWAVLAWQLMAPFDGEDGRYSGTRCESVLFYEGDAPTWEAAETQRECHAERRWPEMLAWLGLSIPLSVGGAVLYTSGTTSLRIREYMAEHRIAAERN